MADAEDEEDNKGLDVALERASCLGEGCIILSVPVLAVVIVAGTTLWVMA